MAGIATSLLVIAKQPLSSCICVHAFRPSASGKLSPHFKMFQCAHFFFLFFFGFCFLGLALNFGPRSTSGYLVLRSWHLSGLEDVLHKRNRGPCEFRRFSSHNVLPLFCRGVSKRGPCFFFQCCNCMSCTPFCSMSNLAWLNVSHFSRACMGASLDLVSHRGHMCTQIFRLRHLPYMLDLQEIIRSLVWYPRSG